MRGTVLHRCPFRRAGFEGLKGVGRLWDEFAEVKGGRDPLVAVCSILDACVLSFLFCVFCLVER